MIVWDSQGAEFEACLWKGTLVPCIIRGAQFLVEPNGSPQQCGSKLEGLGFFSVAPFGRSSKDKPEIFICCGAQLLRAERPVRFASSQEGPMGTQGP